MKNFAAKIIQVISLMLILVPVHSQNASEFNLNGRELFNEGCKEFKMGNYKLADSLFVEASLTYHDKNVIFNHAVARLYLKDTIGFCNGMKTLSFRYFDDEAALLSDSICCSSVDTVYYDRKHNYSSMEECMYYEVIKKLKFEDKTLGIIHKKKPYMSSVDMNYPGALVFFGIGSVPRDLVAAYRLVNGEKYFLLSRKPPRFDKPNATDPIKEKTSNFFSKKYKKFKEDNDIDDSLVISFTIEVHKDGSFSFQEIMGSDHMISLEPVKDELAKDLEDMVHEYPVAKPAQVFHKKVNFIAFDFIEF